MNLGSISLHHVFDIIGAIVILSSLLTSLLPPAEWFVQFPRFQSVYKILVMTIARWGAINLQSVIYKPNGNGNGLPPVPPAAPKS